MELQYMDSGAYRTERLIHRFEERIEELKEAYELHQDPSAQRLILSTIDVNRRLMELQKMILEGNRGY